MSQDCEVPGRPSVPPSRPTGVNFHDTVEVRSSNLKSRVTQLRESQFSGRQSSNLVNRSTVNRSSGSGRTTVRRESTLNQLIDGNVHPAVMGPREKLVPNKRGILKCQMWKVAVLRPRPTEPNLTKTKKFKIQYPMATSNIEIYCPRCDLFFENRNQYLEHCFVKQMKVPYYNKMRLALNSQVCITEMEFNDDRNGKRMHVNKKRKNYKAEELFDEVKDLRDRARMIRKKRARTRYFVSTITDDLKDLANDSTASPNMRRSFKDLINTINAMQGIRIPGAEEGKNSAKNKLFQNEARASIAARAFTSVGPEGRTSRRTNILPPSFL